MADKHLIGICVGGPYNGKRMGSYDREQKVAYRDPPISVAEGVTLISEGKAIVEYKRGAYRWDGGSADEWHWHEPA